MSENYISRQENLTDKQLQILNNELESRRKSVGVAYLFFIFFGLLGVHKFYLEKKKMGISYFLLSVVGWVLYSIGFTFSRFQVEFIEKILTKNILTGLGLFGHILLIVLVILLIRDLFTITQQVNKLEEKYKEEIISEFENKINRDD